MTEELYAEKLTEEIDKVSRDFYIDSYPMSIGETVSMYKQKELILRPAFQRFFRWDSFQKTAFIESILIGIPTSSFFVYQDENSKWEIVDGLQRLSTILEFMGELIGENEKKFPPLKLEKTSYLPHLKGSVWQKNVEDESAYLLPDKLKLALKRAKLQFMIIQSRSNPLVKIEIFRRLNTGGSVLSAQEIRNASLMMVKPDIYTWLEDLSRFQPFQKLTAAFLPTKLLKERYDMEIIVRYLVLSKYNKYQTDTLVLNKDKFLTDKLLLLIDDKRFNREKEDRKFKILLNLIYNLYESDFEYKEFLPSNINNDGTPENNFKILLVEFALKFFDFIIDFLMLGIASQLRIYEENPALLQEKVKKLLPHFMSILPELKENDTNMAQYLKQQSKVFFKVDE